MFDYPGYELRWVIYTGIGAVIFWGRFGRRQLRPFILAKFTDYMKPSLFRDIIEFVLFVGLGIVVGIAVTEPTTTMQAITAGMSWTGAFAVRHHSPVEETADEI